MEDTKTGAMINGSKSVTQFEQFWSFSRHREHGWVLDEIQQGTEGQYHMGKVVNDDQGEPTYGEQQYARSYPPSPWVSSRSCSAGAVPTRRCAARTSASRLDGLAQLDRKWSTESLRRRVRDVFFAVQRSWIERDPEIGQPYMTEQLMDRQRLRIEGLIAQHRVHQFENPLVEDLDFVSFDEGDPNTVDEPRVTTALDISLVETILNADTGALVAGRPNYKIQNSEYWTFVHRDGKWLLDEVEQPGEGSRHMKAPLVGGDYAKLSPEMVLRERYARDEITLEEFEAEMAKFLDKDDPTY